MTNYQKGAAFEREIVNQARKQGKIAFRSAGSHSPVDCCIIDLNTNQIQMIQCKRGILSRKSRESIVEAFKRFSGDFRVEFKLEHKP